MKDELKSQASQGRQANVSSLRKVNFTTTCKVLSADWDMQPSDKMKHGSESSYTKLVLLTQRWDILCFHFSFLINRLTGVSSSKQN